MTIELKAIVPRGPVVPDLEKILNDQLKRAAKESQSEYQKTTRTWRRQPDFEIVEDDEFAIVGTDSEIYEYVDKGTRPHVIRPVRATVLRFNSRFVAKTVPNTIRSRRGVSAPPTVFAKQVNHPGIKARNFSKLIQKTIQGRMTRRINTEIRREVKKQQRLASRGQK